MEDKDCFERHEKLNKELNNHLNEIKDSISAMPEKMSRKFASKLTEKIVFGFCGIVLIAVISSIIGLVVYAKY